MVKREDHKQDADCIEYLRSVGGDAAVALEYHHPDGWTCPECGVYHGEPCPCCGGRGFHTPGCLEVLDAGKPIEEPTTEELKRQGERDREAAEAALREDSIDDLIDPKW